MLQLLLDQILHRYRFLVSSWFCQSTMHEIRWNQGAPFSLNREIADILKRFTSRSRFMSYHEFYHKWLVIYNKNYPDLPLTPLVISA